MKKPVKIILIFLVILLSISIFNKYGWRLFGFRLCTSPENLGISSIEMGDGVLIVTGWVPYLPSSFTGFDGYIAKQTGSTVYIGIKSKWRIGIKPRFTLEIPIEEPVDRIILTDSKSEVSIYDRLFDRLLEDAAHV
ncbi:MAG: hypothetical protein FWH26_06825 [Oscillospiraceae bacterium]|nr:hypothetical protein [Oscillospiraceae bacterium]